MSEILSIGELLDLGGSASTAGLIPYSALEYSAQVITGISGSAIGGQGGGGVDPATVSAIASSYVESGVSGKVDQSAFDNCCSSMSSVVSSLETSVTSMSSVVSGLTGDYLEKSASSMFQPSGDYAYASSLSSYLPGSASSNFAPSGNYAFNSSLSGKLDNSASSTWYPMSGNPSGFLVEHQSLSAYQDRSSISAWTGDMSSISSKLDESAFTSYTANVNIHEYTGISPIVVNNDTDQISLSATKVGIDYSLKAYMSGGSALIGMTYPIKVVSASSLATGSNIIYVVTGSN